MSTEYGLFNDEGLVEGGFWSIDEAVTERDNLDHYDPEDELFIDEVCTMCRGGFADDCDNCGAGQ